MLIGHWTHTVAWLSCRFYWLNPLSYMIYGVITRWVLQQPAVDGVTRLLLCSWYNDSTEDTARTLQARTAFLHCSCQQHSKMLLC
jgi:hypothetical protein